jgi:hypothetical protein
MIYQIRIISLWGRQWTDWFGGMAVSATRDGDTLLTGPVEDQPTLHGLLKRAQAGRQVKLWIFSMFNPLYADVYTLFFNPVLQKELIQKLAEGFAGFIPITQGFVLTTAILIETAIAWSSCPGSWGAGPIAG